MKEMEKWLDIKGYEGLYQVSDWGRVRSLGRVVVVKQDRYRQPRAMHWKPKLLKLSISRPGRNRRGSYASVVLRKNGGGTKVEVHRLVAKAFIPNLENKPVVNHVDHDGLNNRPSNLEWCSIRDNNLHSLSRRPKVFKSFFSEEDRAVLNDLFDNGVGVTAISDQLNLPYERVRYVHRLRNIAQNR